MVKRTGARRKIVVSGDGRGVVSHAGARLLADVAAVTGLTAACSDALAGARQRRGGHDPGRVAVDLAVMLADGGEAIADLAVLRDQAQLFGPVASDPTAWRLLSMMDSDMLRRLATARAQARETAWAQRIDVRSGLPETTAAGLPVPGLVLDLDASIVIYHSEKEAATPTWKRSFGYHPLSCFLDNTREALSGMLREGRAGSNTTADHITVLDDALTQIPDQFRHGTASTFASPNIGPEQQISSLRTAVSPHCPDRSAEPTQPTLRSALEEPGHAPDHRHAQTPNPGPRKINSQNTALDQHLAKDRG